MPLQLATAAANVLRNNHMVRNPVTGLYERSTLLEGTRTNAWTWSDDLSNATWAKAALTLTPGQSDPAGGTTAFKVVEDVTTSTRNVYRSYAGAVTDNAMQAFVVYAKAAERSWLRIRTQDKATVGRISWVNLAAGTVGTKDAGHTIRIRSFANGWQRVEVVVSAGIGTDLMLFAAGPVPANGTNGYLGDGASGIYLWRYQYEVDQPFSSSDIPTAAAAVTRVTDSLSFPFAWAPQEMTLYAKFIERGTVRTPGSARVMHVGAAGNPSLTVYSFNASMYAVQHANGVSAIAKATTVTPELGDLVELRVTLGADGSVAIGISINGAAESATSASAGLPLAAAWSDKRLWLNSAAGGGNGFNAFLSVKVAKGIKSLDQMRLLPPVS